MYQQGDGALLKLKSPVQGGPSIVQNGMGTGQNRDEMGQKVDGSDQEWQSDLVVSGPNLFAQISLMQVQMVGLNPGQEDKQQLDFPHEMQSSRLIGSEDPL